MNNHLLSALIMLFLTFILILGVNAAPMIEREDFQAYFEDGVSAAFVLYDESNDTYLVFNESQSNKRLSPCSTFKIYSSLIGLESGVLDREDDKTFCQWDGIERSYQPANQDHTLASATKYSIVWYFQKFVGQINADEIQAFLDDIQYGNCDMSGGLTTFWLESSLKISAREQVDLLKKLYAGKLPVSAENITVVKNNITVSDEDGIRFMGKTGSGLREGKWILGWFIGCVENKGSRYCFATNIEAPDGANGLKAKKATISILKEMNIL